MYKIIFLAGILVAGCTHTRQISNQKISREDMYVKFNQYALKREGEIKLMDGVVRKGKSFKIESDSIRFIDKLRTDELTVPITGVEYVSFKNTGKGIAEGALIGTLSGLALGLIFVSLAYNYAESSDYDDEGLDDEAVRMFFYGCTSVGVGIISGPIIGGIRGQNKIYVFNKKEE